MASETEDVEGGLVGADLPERPIPRPAPYALAPTARYSLRYLQRKFWKQDSAYEDEFRPVYYIGHHDSKRTEVTKDTLQQALDSNYDMLTVPITTPYFNLRILNALIEYFALCARYGQDAPLPAISALSPLDTNLGPGETTSQAVGVIAPWIDLCSPDPAVYRISCKVLEMEVAYASFCGLGNLLLPAPRLHYGRKNSEGTTQYAHAVQRALEIAAYIHFSMFIPMMDNPHELTDEVNGSLALQARSEYVGTTDDSENAVPVKESSFESQPWELLEVRPKKKIHISSKHDYFGTWDAWNVVRTVCKYSHRLFVALIFPKYLPPAVVCSRWYSEPLKVLNISSRTFYDNKSGYPVLHKEHKALLIKYMRLRRPPWILLSEVTPIGNPDQPGFSAQNTSSNLSSLASPATPTFPTPAEAESTNDKAAPSIDPFHHLTAVRRLQQDQPPRPLMERFCAGYQDYLQAPLQPLTDNLESVTYEVFEKDPIKYSLYTEAIECALSDWRQQRKPMSGQGGKLVLAVTGAGRGPLVTRAIQASETTGVPIELWALEKNSNAFVFLQRQNEMAWGNSVNLVQSDMRSWKGPSRVTGKNCESETVTHYPIDILVSELLGSFADNELSPECLDGVTPLLNPGHGISIPRSYTSYLTPIAAPKLHMDIIARKYNDKEASSTPYVVMLQSVDYLSTLEGGKKSSSSDDLGGTVTATPNPNVQKAWSFQHLGKTDPVDSSNEHNTRHARVTFPIKDRSVCHGLAGYFESVLYPRVELSTHPHTIEAKSKGMTSWFPIYFPLKEPLYVPDDSNLTVSMFRNTDGRKVWYEWIVESWMDVPGASGNQRDESDRKKIKLGVSEVNSSKERGCMM